MGAFLMLTRRTTGIDMLFNGYTATVVNLQPSRKCNENPIVYSTNEMWKWKKNANIKATKFDLYNISTILFFPFWNTT